MSAPSSIRCPQFSNARDIVPGAHTQSDEAIAIASECCPDLLLCDVMMPSLNGFQTALRIKRTCPACRILMFSGHMAAAILLRDSAQAFTDSGYRFELLAKPISPRILLHKVQEALHAWS